MERILSQRGLGRDRHEAPFEYLERTLTVGGLPVQAAIELTELFELARFSDHLIATVASRRGDPGARGHRPIRGGMR